jgi:hypothetical protein
MEYFGNFPDKIPDIRRVEQKNRSMMNEAEPGLSRQCLF